MSIEHAEGTPSSRFEIAGAIQGTLNQWSSPEHPHRLDTPQEEALKAIGIALMDGVSSGYIEMPTSTGKTVVEVLLAQAAAKAGKRVLILAPTTTIANQISGHNSDSGIGKFTTLYDDHSVRQHFGARRANDKARVVVSTYSGFLNDRQNDGVGLGTFDMVIADECHRSLGEKTSEALRDAYPGAVKVGFSATPDFAVDRQSEEVYGTPLYRFSLEEAIEAGKTAPVRPLVYETNQQLLLVDPRGEFTERELAPLANNLERNGTAINMAREFIESDRQGIIRCIPGNDNFHAQALADLLSSYRVNGERNIRAVDIGAHLGRDEQRRRLEAFDDGDIDVLTFTKFLEEGWDSARARFCINLAPTTSSVVTTQLLGRIMRRGDDGRESIFVDFVDSTQGLAKQQFTALHALGLLDVDTERVLGRHQKGTSQRDELLERSTFLFSKELLELFSRSQGKPVEILGKREPTEPVDPLVLKWEKRLASEGMPAELDPHIVFDPTLVQRRNMARRTLEATSEPPPTETAVIEHINLGGLSKDRKRILAMYAIQLPLEVLDAYQTNDYPPEGAFTAFHLEALEDALATLSDREATILRARYGLDTGVAETLSTTGKLVGVSRERAHQIERAALAKLREYPYEYLRSWSAEDTEPQAGPQRANTDIIATGPVELLQYLKKSRGHELESLTQLAKQLKQSRYSLARFAQDNSSSIINTLFRMMGIYVQNPSDRAQGEKAARDALSLVIIQKLKTPGLSHESIEAHDTVMDVLFQMTQHYKDPY